MSRTERRAARRGPDAAARAAAAAANADLGEGALRRELSGAAEQLRRLQRKLDKVMSISDVYQDRLRSARRDVQQLQDLFLPICMFCKRVRADDQYWDKIESYFARRGAVSFSHGICPTCMEQRFGKAEPIPAPLPEPATVRPAARPSAVEARLLAELRAVAARPEVLSAGAGPALRDTADRCERSFARYRKALEISDRYQSEFQARIAAAARVDALTGLATRTAAIDVLEALQAAPEPGRPAWLLLVDLDGLALVNQRAGYEAGDRLLIALARALRRSCAQARLRARWEGDSCAVLLPSDAKRAHAAAEAVLAAVRHLEVGGKLKVTASAGLATARGSSLDSWVRAAEEAVREAKRQGGDRVVVG